MRLRWLLPSLLVALGLCGTALAQTRVSAEEFAGRLDRAAEIAALGTEDPSPLRMSALREALGLPVEVTAAEWILDVPGDAFLDSISGGHAHDFELAGNRVRSLRQALEDAVARDVPTRDQVGEALDRAYGTGVQSQPSLLDHVFRSVGDVLNAVLYRLATFIGSSSILIWAVLLGVVVGAFLLLRRARLVPDWVGPGATGPRALPDQMDWAARADEAVRAGDVREAVRALYLALLATLARGGLLADAPALTAGEARAAVRRAHPTIYPTVARATASYERVVYGGMPPAEGDLEVLREAVARARSR